MMSGVERRTGRSAETASAVGRLRASFLRNVGRYVGSFGKETEREGPGPKKDRHDVQELLWCFLDGTYFSK